MGILNSAPSLNKIIGDLQNRVSNLERSKRGTVPVVSSVAAFPQQPQSGDLMCDASTGFLYVFVWDGSTTLTANASFTTGALTLTVADRTGFKPAQSVKITLGATSYWAVVATTHVAATGAGTIAVSFPTITVPSGWTPPTNPTTFTTGSTVIGSSWRQIACVSDLIAKGVLGAAAGAGGNSVVGSNTGGVGEIIGTGYKAR